jgi:hypothetical protein
MVGFYPFHAFTRAYGREQFQFMVEVICLYGVLNINTRHIKFIQAIPILVIFMQRVESCFYWNTLVAYKQNSP